MPSAVLWIGHRLQRFLMHRIAWSILQPRADDIYIATYPKSGTTLLQMMLYQLKSDGEMSFPHINTVCPWLELEFLRNHGDELEALAQPRCFKTHMLRSQIPRRGRFIYVVRDVRDVIVSAYHHERLIQGKDEGLEKFTERFLREGWGTTCTWFRHLESWWPHRHDPDVLFLSYEEIVADLEAAVRRIAGFCGLALREEDLPRILECCSLSFMKQHEDKFDTRHQRALPDVQGFIRKGEPGGWRELSPRHQELLAKKLSEVAGRLGCARGAPYRELL